MSSKPVQLPSQTATTTNKAPTPNANPTPAGTKTVTLPSSVKGSNAVLQQGPAAPPPSSSGNDDPVYESLLPEIKNFFYTDPVRNPKTNSVSAKIRLNKDSPHNIRFQATIDDEERGISEQKCRLPFAISDPFDKNDKSGQKVANLSIETPGLEMFFKELDENNIRTAHANSVKWFRKQLSIEDVRKMYKPTMRLDTQAEEKKRQPYKPTIKTSVSVDESDSKRRPLKMLEYVGREKVAPYRKMFKNVPVSKWRSVPKFTQVVPIIEISSLWFMPKEFGVSFRCVAMILYPTQAAPPSFNMGKSKNVVLVEDNSDSFPSVTAPASNGPTQSDPPAGSGSGSE